MSNELAVSMDELERESAELLPSRETLNVCSHRGHGGSSFSYTSVTQQDGNTSGGLIAISVLSGSFDNIL
jgi:hypothetical protein